MQYPTIAQPQYGFAPTMPGMASGGLASLPVRRFQDGGVSTAPRYSYNPVTQSYTLLTPEQQANQMMAAQRDNYGGSAEVAPSPFSQMTPAEQASYYAANPTMAGITQLGQQAFGLTSLGMLQNMMDPIGVAQQQTIAQGINPTLATPFGPPGVVTVTPIAPTPTAQLTQMNQEKSEEEETPGVPSIAATVAEALSFADTQDQEAGQNVGAPPGTTADQGGGGGGGGEAPGPDPGTAPSIGGSMDAGGSNNSGNDAGTDGASPSNKQGGLIKYYNQGGVASLANRVQEKGRGQDTMLVHMTPKEVGGLQALAMAHGGSLTINPQTGLPEAGFLSSILPMVAGLALAPMTAGTSLAFLGATPFATAMTVGGITGLATGSLKKGLMAGLGAYGGASLGEGLIGAGSIGGQQAAAAGGADELVKQGFIDQSGNLTSAATQGYNPAMEAAVEAGRNKAAEEFAKKSAFEQLGASTSQAFDQPIGQTMGQLGGKKTAMAVAPTLLSATSDLMPKPEPLKTTPTFIRPFSLDITNPSGTPQYTPQDTREREQVRYAFKPEAIYQAAQGGLTALNGQTYDDEYGRDEYKAGGQAKARSKSLKGNPYYRFADSRRDSSMEAAIEQNFAKGGVKDALPPRFLQGAGDGMSDSIKARIGGMQEARLADGEFVVPADVVSHIGNGSSKAGAKKLYAMMDKIRKARTGRTRQAPEVNPNKYMPA